MTSYLISVPQFPDSKLLAYLFQPLALGVLFTQQLQNHPKSPFRKSQQSSPSTHFHPSLSFSLIGTASGFGNHAYRNPFIFFSLKFNEAPGVGLQQGPSVPSHHPSVGSCCPLGQDVAHHSQNLTTKRLPSPFHFFFLFPCSNSSLMEKTSDVP